MDNYDDMPSPEYEEARSLLLALIDSPSANDPTSPERREYRRAWERWMTASGCSFTPVPDDHR